MGDTISNFLGFYQVIVYTIYTSTPSRRVYLFRCVVELECKYDMYENSLSTHYRRLHIQLS